MEYKLIGDRKVSAIGFGTHRLAGVTEADRSRDAENIALVRKALELGITHFDTAEIYGGGHAEEMLGAAVQGYDREDLFIASKVWSDNLRPEALLRSLKASLQRLRTDYLNLYYVHWPNPQIPLQETMRALEKCQREGLIRAIGVSNFSAALMQEAQSYLEGARIVANQVEYSLAVRAPLTELLPVCKRERVVLVAYRPLVKGRLAVQHFPLLDALAAKYQKTPAQVALNWVISHENESAVTIPKTGHVDRLVENVDAVGWKLERDDWERLRQEKF